MQIAKRSEQLQLSGSEQQQLDQLLNHIFFGLAAENLVDNSDWQYGPKDDIKKFYSEAKSGGIVCSPSAFGAELFLWAFGRADQHLKFIFHETFRCDVPGVPSVVSGICATKKSKKT